MHGIANWKVSFPLLDDLSRKIGTRAFELTEHLARLMSFENILSILEYQASNIT